jgi:hypothetical protein
MPPEAFGRAVPTCTNAISLGASAMPTVPAPISGAGCTLIVLNAIAKGCAVMGQPFFICFPNCD